MVEYIKNQKGTFAVIIGHKGTLLKVWTPAFDDVGTAGNGFNEFLMGYDKFKEAWETVKDKGELEFCSRIFGEVELFGIEKDKIARKH